MADHYDEQRERFGCDRTIGRAETKQDEVRQTICDAAENIHNAFVKMGESTLDAYERSMQKEHKPDDVEPEFMMVGKSNFKIKNPIPEIKEFNHYYINVSNYNYIDIYRVTDLYGATSAEHHAVKKILCGGKRGAKDKIRDLKEAMASIERQIEMLEEDA